jgi:hypothetical protein
MINELSLSAGTPPVAEPRAGGDRPDRQTGDDAPKSAKSTRSVRYSYDNATHQVIVEVSQGDQLVLQTPSAADLHLTRRLMDVLRRILG